MAANKGFPGNPSQLTSAVRKALFTSATVTAIAVGAPGHNAYAQQVGVCNPIETEFTSGTVQCSGDFDATIDYAVDDVTVVDGKEQPTDITVVVAEGSTGTGISVSSLPADSSAEPAEGSVVIENHGDLTKTDEAGIEIPDGVEQTRYDMGIRIGSKNSNDGGHFFDSYVVLNENGKLDRDEDGNAVGERVLFEREVGADEIGQYLGIDPSNPDYNMFQQSGPEDEITFLLAEEGTFEGGASAALSAETDASSIHIENSGDITAGSGQSVTYYTSVKETHANTYDELVKIEGRDPFVVNYVDVDGDGIDDIGLWKGEHTVFVDPNDVRTATVAAAGIGASSNTGNISVSNAGSINGGDISIGISADTVEGDIAISNSGDIDTGANSAGIHASSAVVTEVGHAYSYIGQEYAVEYNAGSITTQQLLGYTTVKFTAPSYSHFKRDYTAYANVVDTSDSVIMVANSGSISVGEAGVGIQAENPSGAGIEIANSGDITIAEGIGGAGIYASTHAGLETTREKAYCFRGCIYDRIDTFYIGEGEANPEHVQNGLISRDEANDVDDGTDTIDVVVETGDEGEESSNFNTGEQTGIDGEIIKTGVYYTHLVPVTESKTDVPHPLIPDAIWPLPVNNVWTGEYVEQATQHNTYLVDWVANGYFDDRGDITIINSGNIDASGTYFAAGINAVGHGSTTIQNTGNIEVGALGAGINSRGVGETIIDNEGRIYLHGAGSSAIQVNSTPFGMDSVETSGFAQDAETAEMFGGFENGDITIVNSGEIASVDTSGLTVYNENGMLEAFARTSSGISVGAHGANLIGSSVKWAQYGQATVDKVNAGNYTRYQDDMAKYEAGEIELDEVHQYSKIEIDDSVELYTTSILNTGEISLSNMSRGIDVSAQYGTVIVENRGSVSVGDGIHGMAPETYAVVTQKSTAISVSNAGQEGLADHFVVNRGEVVAGDNGEGIRSNSWHGSSYVYNEGSVTVGSGDLIDAAETEFRDYNHGSTSTGIASIVAGGNDAYALVQNSGEVTTGDRAFGMVASNVFTTGAFLSEEFGHNYTAAAINSGVISTGDHSTGMGVLGYISLGYNSGSISIGSGLMQNLDTVEVAAGMKTLLDTGLQSNLINAGEISGGDQAVGIFAEAMAAGAVQLDGASVIVGDDGAGIVARGSQQAVAQNLGSIQAGNGSTGIQAMASNTQGIASFATAVNTGSVTLGDDSVGMQAFGTLAQAVNTGDIHVGDNAVGVMLSSAAVASVDPETGEEFTVVGRVVNEGSIHASGEGSFAIQSTEDFDAQIINSGLIDGSIAMGAGDDFLYNAVQTDANGSVVAAGQIHLHNASIDMGEGANTFRNVFGDIAFSGDSVIDLGAEGVMQNYSSGGSYVTISAMDDTAGDTLTINGDVNFTAIQGNNGLFLVDMSSKQHDRIVINGDLTAVNQVNADGATQPSTLGVAINVTDQGKGEQTLDILTVNGAQDLGSVSLAAVGGDFADTILEAEMQQDGNGNWVIAYTAGLSDLGAAASSVSHLAESFWTRSATAFFDTERAANVSESSRVEGLHAWSSVFHTDSDVESRSDVKGQDLAYTQLLSNHMAGATYNTKLGGTWLSISPMVGKGYADGNQLAQQSSAALDTETFALNGTLSMGDFYASAMYQQVDFDANVRAYDSAAMTSGQAKGYSLEGGWTYLMESGIAMTSYAQWSDVKSEIDGFTSSDSNFDYAYNLGSTSTTRLGLSMRKSFKLSDGFAMPYASFSVADSSNHSAHDLHSNGVVFNSDVSGTGFNLDFGVDGKYKLWTIKSGLGVHSGETDKNGLSAHFAISRSL